MSHKAPTPKLLPNSTICRACAVCVNWQSSVPARLPWIWGLRLFVQALQYCQRAVIDDRR